MKTLPEPTPHVETADPSVSDVAPQPVRAYPGDPFVTVICPCFNEERFIKECLTSILEGDYPSDKLEVLVVDGRSTDGTPVILEELCQQHPNLRVVDNPRRIKPVALNLGIEQARGEVLVRIDGHARYSKNYVKQLVHYLLTYDVVNVGGIRRNLPASQTFVARTLARLLTHAFGVGDARHYTGVDQPSYTNIVFLFCVRRSLFDEVGLFKEPLIRGQDREFNLRVAATGKKMLLVPDVTSEYFARDKLSKFIPWALEAGATPFRINRFAAVSTVSIRNLVPVMFVLSILVGLLALPFTSLAWYWLLAVLVPYFTLAFYAGCRIALDERDPRFLLSMPIAFFAWHCFYGLGAIRAMLEEAFRTDGVPA